MHQTDRVGHTYRSHTCIASSYELLGIDDKYTDCGQPWYKLVLVIIAFTDTRVGQTTITTCSSYEIQKNPI